MTMATSLLTYSFPRNRSLFSFNLLLFSFLRSYTLLHRVICFYEYAGLSDRTAYMDSKPRRASLLGFLSFLLCAASLIVVLNFSQGPSPLDFSSRSWWTHSAYTKRADKGDLYLLGIGKADITG